MDHLNLLSPKMNDWIKLTSDHRKWGEYVEVKLGLAMSTYKPYAKHNGTSQTNLKSQHHQYCQLFRTKPQQSHKPQQ
jgi:hypothetical protein